MNTHNGNCHGSFCPVNGYNYKIIGSKKVGQHYEVPIRKFFIKPDPYLVLGKTVSGIRIDYPDSITIQFTDGTTHSTLQNGEVITKVGFTDKHFGIESDRHWLWCDMSLNLGLHKGIDTYFKFTMRGDAGAKD